MVHIQLPIDIKFHAHSRYNNNPFPHDLWQWQCVPIKLWQPNNGHVNIYIPRQNEEKERKNRSLSVILKKKP